MQEPHFNCESCHEKTEVPFHIETKIDSEVEIHSKCKCGAPIKFAFYPRITAASRVDELNYASSRSRTRYKLISL